MALGEFTNEGFCLVTNLGIIKKGEVSEWFMVPLSKSGLAFSERGFESHPLRFFAVYGCGGGKG